MRDAVGGFLGTGDPDRDDLIQETLLALLRYLRGGGEPPDNPEAFCVTIARNRCRNLYQWRKLRPTTDVESACVALPDPDAGPLEMLAEAERRTLLRAAFADLNRECRNLLHAFYIEETSMETLRRRSGLSSVQGVYHRKNVCLQHLTRLFNRRLLGGRSAGGRP